MFYLVYLAICIVALVLERLAQLRSSGSLSEVEFEIMKAAVLSSRGRADRSCLAVARSGPGPG